MQKPQISINEIAEKAQTLITNAQAAQKYALAHPVYDQQDYERAGADPNQSKTFQLNALYLLSVIVYVSPAPAQDKPAKFHNWHFAASLRLAKMPHKAVALSLAGKKNIELLKSQVRTAAVNCGDETDESLKQMSHVVTLKRALTAQEEMTFDQIRNERAESVGEVI